MNIIMIMYIRPVQASECFCFHVIYNIQRVQLTVASSLTKDVLMLQVQMSIQLSHSEYLNVILRK